MREIKFRAWDGQKFGYISIGYDRITWPSSDYFEQKLSGLREGSPEQVRFANVESFQQFTGLHDKNGKEIYEGDIVLEHDNRRYVVRWYEQEATIRLDIIHKDAVFGGSLSFASCDSINIGVIGNIYENSELLNQSV